MSERSPAIPPRKPMATASRVSLFEREVRVRLSSAAVEILLSRAAVLSEGQLEGDNYFGSTMITLDCVRVAHLVSDACDAATVKRVQELATDDDRVRARAQQVAIAEAHRLSEAPVESAQVDLHVSHSGTHLHIDLDVEATRAGYRLPTRSRAI